MASFIKIVVVFVAGILGVLAAASESRDSATKRLTTSGRVLVGLIVASTLMSLGLSWSEVRDQAERDANARRQFEIAVDKQELTLRKLNDLVARQERTAAQTSENLKQLLALQRAVDETTSVAKAVHKESISRFERMTLDAARTLSGIHTLDDELLSTARRTDDLQAKSGATLQLMQNVLASVMRLRTPFAIAAVEFNITRTFDERQAETWLERIRRVMPNDPPRFGVIHTGRGRAWMFADGDAVTVQFPSTDAFLPQPGETDAQTRALFACLHANLRFSTQRDAASDLDYQLVECSIEPDSGDSLASFMRASGEATRQERSDVTINFMARTVTRRVIAWASTPIHDSGRIRSVMDLWRGEARIQIVTAEGAEIAEVKVFPDASMATFYELPAPAFTAGDGAHIALSDNVFTPQAR